MQDMKMTDQVARHENEARKIAGRDIARHEIAKHKNAGHKNAGQNCRT